MSNINLSKKELYVQGYTVKEMSIMLNVTEASLKMYIKRHLSEYKEDHLKNREIKYYSDIKHFYMSGYTAKEISDFLYESYDKVRKYIYRHLSDCKEEHLNNKGLRRKTLYLKGYNAIEIAKILDEKSANVRKYISLHLSNYKEDHLKNRAMNKEIKKSIDYMNNSYMGNRAILDWNRQSYNYNKNGNLVFNEKHGARPKDLPKYFYKKDGMINNLEESSISMALAVNHLLK